MKKQILIFAAAFVTVAFISCSKEKTEITPVDQSVQSTSQLAEVAKASNDLSIPPVLIDPLKVGLLGQFEFDANLKDNTGKLETGYSTLTRVPVTYTYDRKGQANKAIRFNGKYGVDLFDVPAYPDGFSVSIWVKSDTIPAFWLSMLSSWQGFHIQQLGTTVNCSFFNGIVGSPQEVESTVDNKWHHLAATRDNSIMKFYKDGVLIGTSPTPAGGGPYYSKISYSVGHDGPEYWKGNIDDLRFYKRVLSASDVTKLKSL